jgi:hypothetical protein
MLRPNTVSLGWQVLRVFASFAGMFRGIDAPGLDASYATPTIYKEFFPHDEIISINLAESQKPPGSKLRPIYFGTIYVRDGRESAIVKIGAMNVLVVFEEMPEEQQVREDTLRTLKQLLFDHGFGPCQSGWISFDTVYVTVTAGFTSSHDLNQKLASSKRKIIKPENVRSIQVFTEKPRDTASDPMITISAFSDDVSSASPTCHMTR